VFTGSVFKADPQAPIQIEADRLVEVSKRRRSGRARKSAPIDAHHDGRVRFETGYGLLAEQPPSLVVK
jgi:hypothetical protein